MQRQAPLAHVFVQVLGRELEHTAWRFVRLKGIDNDSRLRVGHLGQHVLNRGARVEELDRHVERLGLEALHDLDAHAIVAHQDVAGPNHGEPAFRRSGRLQVRGLSR